jgi:hypothetical protein
MPIADTKKVMPYIKIDSIHEKFYIIPISFVLYWSYIKEILE